MVDIRGVAIKFREFSYSLGIGSIASFVNIFLKRGDHSLVSVEIGSTFG